MLILSYNVRELGGPSKVIALQCIITIEKQKLIALQETMMEGEKAKEVMRRLLKEWQMEAINVEGHLGGLITSWSPYIICHSKAFNEATLETELEDPESRTQLKYMHEKKAKDNQSIMRSNSCNRRPFGQHGNDFL